MQYILQWYYFDTYLHVGNIETEWSLIDFHKNYMWKPQTISLRYPKIVFSYKVLFVLSYPIDVVSTLSYLMRAETRATSLQVMPCLFSAMP